MASLDLALSNIDTELFIIEIKNRPILWDQTKREYSDRNRKKKAWEEVCALFIQDYSEKTVKKKNEAAMALQKRWKGIRGSYIKNKHKQIKRGAAGSPSKEYLYSHLLSFLKPTMRPLPSKSPQSDDGNSSDVDTNASTAAKKARTSNYDEEEKLIQVLIQSMDNRYQSKDRVGESDTEKTFLLSLVDDLKAIHSDYKIDAKMEIMTVIKKYKSSHPAT